MSRTMCYPDPVILIDTREQTPLCFDGICASRRATLRTGDYSAEGLETVLAVERKTLDDLAQTVTRGRERFERELERIRAFPFLRLLIIGCWGALRRGRYHGRVNPRAVIASISAFEARYGLPVVFAATAQDAAERVYCWARYILRERIKNKANNV